MDRLKMFGLFVVLGFGLVGTTGLNAQLPDEFTNLKVLPADIARGALQGYMRGMADGLGVRCEYCHVGEPGAQWSEMDFASDEKATKLKARAMLQMVQAINGQHLATLPDRSDPALDVTCMSCHRGLSKPQTLQSVLVAEAANGADAAVAKYRELREQYYGTWSYDFSVGTLIDAAQTLARNDNFAAGIALAMLNLEFYGQTADAHFAIAELHRQNGDNAAAIPHYEHTLRFDPQHRAATRRLSDLRG